MVCGNVTVPYVSIHQHGGEQEWVCETDMRRITRPTRYRLLALQLLCMSLIACGGSGEGLYVSGRPISEGGDLPLAPTLASVQANVFNPN